MGRKSKLSAKPLIIFSPRPGAEYVTKTQYMQKRVKEGIDVKSLWPGNIARAIQRGEIEVYRQGDRDFIDWNTYKSHHFATHSWSQKN